MYGQRGADTGSRATALSASRRTSPTCSDRIHAEYTNRPGLVPGVHMSAVANARRLPGSKPAAAILLDHYYYQEESGKYARYILSRLNEGRLRHRHHFLIPQL